MTIAPIVFQGRHADGDVWRAVAGKDPGKTPIPFTGRYCRVFRVFEGVP